MVLSAILHSLNPLTTIGTLVTLAASYLFYIAYFHPKYISPLRFIPGPPNNPKYNKYNLPIYGLLFDILRSEAGVTFREWTEQYGGILCFPSMFNTRIVHIADPEAIRHVLVTHAYQYPKTDRVIRVMSAAIGIGLLLSEGDVHKKQYRLFSSVFSYKNIKEMVPTMAAQSENLCKIWGQYINQAENNSIEINIITDLSSCILNIIGLTAFGYDFKAMENPDDPILKFIDEYFGGETSAIHQLFRHYVPGVRARNLRRLDEVLRQVISMKIALAASGMDSCIDLISIMLRTAESDSTYEDFLNDDDLLAQAKTFIGAGHDTTCVSVAWMLHVLSTRPEVQSRLRQEFLTNIGRPTADSKRTLSYDALNALPYLNACIKELMRFIPPIPNTSRVASRDDVILGYHIPKGTEIWIFPAAIHKLKCVYGDDAEEFKPERWMDPYDLTVEQRQTIKTVTSDMMWAYMPFLVGPRSCIGSKLALIEIKVILYYLLSDFEFFPSPGFKFRKSARITLRPSPGMNLIIKKVKHRDCTISMLRSLAPEA
ncbi:hypothetical protein FBU30_000913 [Linnemannia zychae]|nr:hypothetical protein FBU30_000913 [Linnemannia zychae]